jgi:hypothetical protein
MQKVSIKDIKTAQTHGVQHEQYVSGVLRGGHIYNNYFWFCGSVQYGCFRCEVITSHET